MPLNLQCAAAQLVYGTSVQLPAEFVCQWTSQGNKLDTPFYLKRLQDCFKAICAVAPQHNSTHKPLLKGLQTATRIFPQTDAVCKSLQPPYTGPHLAIEGQDKLCTICVGAREDKVSTNRLKSVLCRAPQIIPVFTLQPVESHLEQLKSGYTGLIKTPSIQQSGPVACQRLPLLC